MEPEDQHQKKVIRVRYDGPKDFPMNHDEILNWLETILGNVVGNDRSNIVWVSSDGSEAGYGEVDGLTAEMQELDYLDSMVSGDEHPDALNMIMSAYRKNQES